MSRSESTTAPAIGHAINIDTKSYDRIFGMLLGIRVHVSRISAQPIVPLRGGHFDEYEKIEIPREGNHTSPAHRGRYDYKFKAYAPVVFMHLRHYFGITDDEYLVSITADYMMSELKTIGRSSAMFYYTWDGRYILKTLTKGECNCLRKMLPRYYQYVTNHPDTFVNQFFGAYRSQTSMGRPIRFVIMNNVFPIGFQIHYKFDLKGSVVNRSVSEEKRNHPGSTWKEAEFMQKRYLHVGPRDWNLLRAQLLDDTNFLSSVGVMDYSLMVGIHQFNPDSPIMHPPMGERIEILSVFTPDQSSRSRYVGNSVIVRKMEMKGGKKKKKIGETEKSKLDFGPEKPFAAVMPQDVSGDNPKLLSFCGGLRGTTDLDEPISEIYFMGIIDFLQYYNRSKKAEHFFKRAVYKKDAMSCVSPEKYAQRMFDFLCRTIGQTITPEREEMLERRRQRLTEMSRPAPPELEHTRDVQLESEGSEKKTKKELKKEKKLMKKQAKKEKKEEKKLAKARKQQRKAEHHHSAAFAAPVIQRDPGLSRLVPQDSVEAHVQIGKPALPSPGVKSNRMMNRLSVPPVRALNLTESTSDSEGHKEPKKRSPRPPLPPKPEAKPEAKPEPKTETEPEPKTEVKTEAKPEVKPEPKTEVKPKAEPKSESESEAQSKSESESESSAKSESDSSSDSEEKETEEVSTDETSESESSSSESDYSTD